MLSLLAQPQAYCMQPVSFSDLKYSMNFQFKLFHHGIMLSLFNANPRLEITLVESKQLEDFDLKLFHIVDRISFERRIVCHSTFQNWPLEPRTGDTTSIMKVLETI